MKKINKQTKLKFLQLGISLIFLILGFFNWYEIANGQGGLLAFYYVNPSWVAVVLCGFPIFKKAFKLLKNKKLKVPVLVSIAMIGSIALEITSFFVDFGKMHRSYVFAAGEIAFLMSIGGWIESLTVKKCKSGIERLVNLIPKIAQVIVDDKIIKKELKDIKIGDTVLVKAGEMISVDGVITKGNCTVDQSSVTGEYLPVELKENDKVFGGTFNKNGTIEIRVEKLLKDMTIAKMADLVKEAEGKKAPISTVADKWVSVIVPSLFILSTLTGVIAYFALNTSIAEACVRAITVLIVFCPCAFALATPTAIAAGLGNSAKNGILIKSGESLEELSRIKTICFDKTGTLTEGNIKLSNVIVKDFNKTELLELCASLEKYSEHPLSSAVVNYAKDLKTYEATKIKTLMGVGISGVVNNKKVDIKNIEKIENTSEFEKEIDDLLNQGKTTVGILIDDKFVGVFGFSDTIRKGAKETVLKLKEKGYNLVMLTGDNKKSANYIANLCGIDTVYSSLMPEDKINKIKEFQENGEKVCMLGDGINDAPSLKMANVSLAMGALGSDIAIDSSDMAILNSDIKKLAQVKNLSNRVIRTIKTNIIIAMSINLITTTLSLFGYLNPATGAVMHNLTSIFVVSCSAMLLRTPKKERQELPKDYQKPQTPVVENITCEHCKKENNNNDIDSCCG